jgi:hypothetical protein
MHKNMKHILWTFSSVGYSHMFRDILAMTQLREIIDVEIDVLAPPPLCNHPALNAFNVLPESKNIRSSGTVYDAAFRDRPGDYDLIHFIKEDGRYYESDCSVFNRILSEKTYDLVFGDESFWLITGISMNWVPKRFLFAYMSEFLGMHQMSSRAEDEMFFRMKNSQFLLSTNFMDKFLYIGSSADIPDEPFGKGLPNQRRWAERHCTYVDSIVKFPAGICADKTALRMKLALPANRRIFLFMTYFVGDHFRKTFQKLIESTINDIQKDDPSAFFIIVNPDLQPFSDENQIVTDFISDAYQYYTACDMVLSQAGLSKATELSLSGTPFILIPPDYHFEAEYLLGIKLKNSFRGGKMVLLRDTTPKSLYEEIVGIMGTREPVIPIPSNDGSQVASIIRSMLESN